MATFFLFLRRHTSRRTIASARTSNNKHRKEFVSNCHSRLLLLLLLLLSSLSKKRTHRSFYDYFARRLSKRRSRRIFLRLSTGQRNALNLILHRAWPGRFDEFAALSLLLTYPRNTLRDNTGTIPLPNRSNGTHDSSRLNVLFYYIYDNRILSISYGKFIYFGTTMAL